jgi:hypothetical protein
MAVRAALGNEFVLRAIRGEDVYKRLESEPSCNIFEKDTMFVGMDSEPLLKSDVADKLWHYYTWIVFLKNMGGTQQLHHIDRLETVRCMLRDVCGDEDFNQYMLRTTQLLDRQVE